MTSYKRSVFGTVRERKTYWNDNCGYNYYWKSNLSTFHSTLQDRNSTFNKQSAMRNLQHADLCLPFLSFVGGVVYMQFLTACFIWQSTVTHKQTEKDILMKGHWHPDVRIFKNSNKMFKFSIWIKSSGKKLLKLKKNSWIVTPLTVKNGEFLNVKLDNVGQTLYMNS